MLADPWVVPFAQSNTEHGRRNDEARGTRYEGRKDKDRQLTVSQVRQRVSEVRVPSKGRWTKVPLCCDDSECTVCTVKVGALLFDIKEPLRVNLMVGVRTDAARLIGVHRSPCLTQMYSQSSPESLGGLTSLWYLSYSISSTTLLMRLLRNSWAFFVYGATEDLIAITELVDERAEGNGTLIRRIFRDLYEGAQRREESGALRE